MQPVCIRKGREAVNKKEKRNEKGMLTKGDEEGNEDEDRVRHVPEPLAAPASVIIRKRGPRLPSGFISVYSYMSLLHLPLLNAVSSYKMHTRAQSQHQERTSELRKRDVHVYGNIHVLLTRVLHISGLYTSRY